MSKALIAGINQVATDKGLEREVIFSAIEAALISAYKRNYGSVANVSAEIDRDSGEMKVFAEREVVDELFNLNTEIELEEARVVAPEAELGDVIKVQSTPADFGRIAAQTAKQVILQRIREAERDTVYENFVHKVGELINAQVRSVDTNNGTVTVMLDKHESLLPREEQIPTENLRRGDYVRLYVVDVHKSNRGPVIRLSRTHRNLLRRLMEQEIPEVRDGTVELKAIAREPGARSKVAVAATVPNVDPVGSCVGVRGIRIQNIVNELAGEKIDVVEWSMDLRQYIANALSPAKVQSVVLDEETPVKTAVVIVPDRQLSLAIGKEGQNARLAAKLTGWRIDIKSETEAREEGLDLLAAKQAQEAVFTTVRDDLLSMAERILQSSDPDEEREDRFRQAAQAIQRQDEGDVVVDRPETDVEWPGELPEDDGVETEERKAALDAFDRAAASVGDDEVPTLPSLDDFTDQVESAPTFDEIEEAETAAGEAAVAAEAGLETPAEAETAAPEAAADEAAEELPQVITADMLRQRMAARKAGSLGALDSLDDIEVPAELLAGLDDDVEDEDLDEDDEFRTQERKRNKGRRSVAPKAKAKRGKRPKRRYYDSSDEEEDE